MAKFFNPDDMGDKRLHMPATTRNRDFLKDVYGKHMPKHGTLVEIASGTGEHAIHIAASLKPLKWQPTDIDESHIESINAWREHLITETNTGDTNILPAKRLDILEGLTEQIAADDITAVCATNLIHIAPFSVAEALISNAGSALSSSGILILYGPYKRDGKHTAPSNDEFDQSLRSRNPEWGVRDMEVITDLAQANGFETQEIIPMPANNFSLVFRKT